MGNVGLCVFDGISASVASILAFSFLSSSLKCSETFLEFFFNLNISTPNLTLKKLKTHYARFVSCCFFKHIRCRKRSCKRILHFWVSLSVSANSQVLLCWQTLPLQRRVAPAVRRSSAAPPPRTPASDAPAPSAAPRCGAESHPAEGDAAKTVMDVDKVRDRACCHCTNWSEIDVGWQETCDGASVRKFRNVAHREKHAADTPYLLPAQSFHHRVQAVVGHQHGGGDAGGGGGLTTLQLLLQFGNLPFQRLVLLLETMSLKGIKSEQVCAVCGHKSTASFTRSKRQDHNTAEGKWRASPVQSAGPGGRWGQRWRCGPGQTGSDPPCSAPWQRRSPTCHSRTCQQPHPWEEDTEPETGLNSEWSDRSSSDWLQGKLVTERNNLPKTETLIIVITCNQFGM